MSAPTRDAVVQLSLDEYAAVWEHLGLGQRHWNLDPPGGAVRTAEAKAGQDARAWDALRRRDLARGRDVAPQLEDGLHAVARGPVELNGTVDTPDGRVRLVGATRAAFSVVAELYPQGLRLRFARDAALPAVVVAPLPDRPPVPGTAVSAPTTVLAAAGTGEETERALVRGGVRAEDAATFRAMIRGRLLLCARFGAARRDQHGRRHTAGTAVAYVATEHGGYTVEERRGPDGTAWTTVAPASKADLAHRLDRLLAAVRVTPPR